ncbi:DUF305 domain-containing protein [Actinophytocola glycyrrhizae]|uniref:DUF305 domain-containing protein n=1 Tax=Actinophytocola glycyrrhizae TaxID=2044873 RepID=A0ABV9S4V8_9PSEU
MTSAAPSSSGSRTFILIAALVAVLLVGAAGGMLINSARSGADDAFPSAESVDVGFAHDMRVHHLQAVTMAGIERDKTADPVLRGFAFDVESTQLAQSSEMAGWLTVWGHPQLPEAGAPYMQWMSENGTHTHSNGEGGTTTGPVQRMPGMATTEELNKLRTLTGKELDVFFLQLMLRHHVGGLEMAQYAADHAAKGYVRNLADKIVQSQESETNLMKSYLAERGAQPLPFP